MRNADIQFAAVEKGTIFGWTISGMYSQTTGPRDNPKTIMKANNPNRIRKLAKLLLAPSSDFLMKNPIAMITHEHPSPMLPACRMIFLPNLVSKYPVNNVAANCSKFKIDGKYGLTAGRTYPATLPPYATTELMPENCWRIAKWMAMTVVIGFLVLAGFS